MFTSLYRRLLSRELGVLGGRVAQLERLLEDAALEAASLKARLDSFQKRVGMRLSRATRTDRDDQAEAAVRAAAGSVANPEVPEWPEVTITARRQ